MKQICQHFQSLGVSAKDSNRHSQMIINFIKTNGKEWTVSRYKSLQSALKLNLANGKYNLPDGWATRKNSKGQTILKDGFIHRLLCSKTQQEVFIANAVFKVHTLLSVSEITKKQKSKFDKAVLGDSTITDIDLYEKTKSDICLCLEKYLKGMKIPDINVTPLRYQAKGNKTSPTYKRPKNIKYGNQYIVENKKRTDIRTKSLAPFVLSNEGFEHLQKYPNQCSWAILGHGDSFLSYAAKYERLSKVPVGTIGYIQEPSCKLRAIASPALVYQALGESLKQKSKFIIENIELCDTKDHQEGRIKAQMWLWEGRTVFGFDASSFTDRLPLDLQLRILDVLVKLNLISDFDRDTFELVSKGSYRDNVFNRDIKWKVGQPQGFGPSFNIATLTHVAIVLSCMTHPEQEKLASLIGDDVLIADLLLASAYQDKMELLGVDINREKSLSSDNVAEYAGKIITSEGIIPSAKIKSIPLLEEMSLKDVKSLSDRLVTQLLFYGPKKWLNISKEHREYAIKAILPSWAGGIGFKHPKIQSKVNFDALRDKSIRTDVDEYFTTHSRDDMESYLNWISDFDQGVCAIIPTISPTAWARYTGGSVNKISSFNGMPIHPNKGVSTRDISINGHSKDQVNDPQRESFMVDLLVQYLYQIQNPDLKKSVIIYDYEASISKLREELTQTQTEYHKYGIPYDYIKFFISPEGYIRNEFLDKLQSHNKLKSLIPNNMKEQDVINPKDTCHIGQGLNHVKYIKK